MPHFFDVVIVGGGPAGCASAIALAQKKFRVALIEKSNYQRMRIGETLLPAARVPLEQLGFGERLRAYEHLPSPGTVSLWSNDELYENDFIFNPYGNGWHLDRARFDGELASRAEEGGAKIFRNARVTGFDAAAARWQIEFVCEGNTETVQAAFLVDASGRARFVTRSLGVNCRELDHLVGLVRFFRIEEQDNRTLVEAARDGWWYSAWLPEARLVVAYMTDADLIADVSRQAREDEWIARLSETRYTRRRVGNNQRESTVSTWSANSYLIEYVAGENWLAVGDAAMAVDPLSAQGIYNGLESGLRAGDAIEKWFEDEEGLEKYADWLNTRFDSYARNRARYYARETRWADSIFWQRRQTINEYNERTRG